MRHTIGGFVRVAMAISVIGGLLVGTSLFSLGAEVDLIWDDDGDPSGLLGLLLFLAHPRINVVAASVVVGEAVPPVYSTRLALMLERLGCDLRVTYGPTEPSQGSNEFPDPWRRWVTTFFGLDVCQVVDCPGVSPTVIFPEPNADAVIAQAIMSTLRSPEDLVIFAAGPLTNVYWAFETWELLHTQGEIEQIANKALSLEIMGGAVDVPGNLVDWYENPPNDKAEFNMWIDPHAAAVVFGGPQKIHMTPLDVTNVVYWTLDDVVALEQIDSCIARVAAALLRKLYEAHGPQPFWGWDLDAAALTAIRVAEGGTVSVNGELWTPTISQHCLGVDTSPQYEGWTRSIFCRGDWNVAVYHVDTPAEAQLLKDYVISVFAQTAP